MKKVPGSLQPVTGRGGKEMAQKHMSDALDESRVRAGRWNEKVTVGESWGLTARSSFDGLRSRRVWSRRLPLLGRAGLTCESLVGFMVPTGLPYVCST